MLLLQRPSPAQGELLQVLLGVLVLLLCSAGQSVAQAITGEHSDHGRELLSACTAVKSQQALFLFGHKHSSIL
uniref:Uncharacterized protein n=1 Tax=Arundo donax TaxID=35708 RepID=A0A0A8YW50_ARUDO